MDFDQEPKKIPAPAASGGPLSVGSFAQGGGSDHPTPPPPAGPNPTPSFQGVGHAIAQGTLGGD